MEDYTHFDLATQLSESLKKFNIALPNYPKLSKACYLYFSNQACLYLNLRDIGICKSSSFFHVEIGDYLETGYQKHGFVRDLTQGLSIIFDIIDESHLYPDEISWSENHVEVIKNKKSMARIKIIEAFAFDEAYIGVGIKKQVSNALKGINAYYDEDKLFHRLKSINGLSNLKGNSKDHSNGNVDELKKLLKYSKFTLIENLGVYLRRMLLNVYKVDIKLSLALEIVADCFGDCDWNTFISKARKYEISIIDPYLMEIFKDGCSSVYFFSNAAEATSAMVKLTNLYSVEKPDYATLNFSYDNENQHTFNLTLRENTLQGEGPIIANLGLLSEIVLNDDFYIDWLSEQGIATFSEAAKLLINNFPPNKSFSEKLEGSNKRLSDDTLKVRQFLFTHNKYTTMTKIQIIAAEEEGVILIEGQKENELFAYIEEPEGAVFISRDTVNEVTIAKSIWGTTMNFSNFSNEELIETCKFCGFTLEIDGMTVHKANNELIEVQKQNHWLVSQTDK